jgi:hypothetical protein
MHRVIAFAALALCSLSARAALPPHYYEEARRTADSVVVISVAHVRGLWLWRGYGDCRVSGRVERVERGERYRPDDPIVVDVPCRRAHAEIPASGVQYQDLNELRRSRRGRAWLTPDGALALYQYDILGAQ